MTRPLRPFLLLVFILLALFALVLFAMSDADAHRDPDPDGNAQAGHGDGDAYEDAVTLASSMSFLTVSPMLASCALSQAYCSGVRLIATRIIVWGLGFRPAPGRWPPFMIGIPSIPLVAFGLRQCSYATAQRRLSLSSVPLFR